MRRSTTERAMPLTHLSTIAAAVGLAGLLPAPPRAPANPTASSRQIVVVTTPAWDATSGTMRRFARRTTSSAWTAVGEPVAVVIGRTGLALGLGFEELERTRPAKREGDGKSPAGIFPLDTVFGFAPRESARAIRLPYAQLTEGSDCVDDTASSHYNTIVDKLRIGRVDWASAEHMRQIAQYEQGVVVGYNAPRPEHGGGSCIFLHIWSGPTSHTAGCTAMDAGELSRTVQWLDRSRRPMLVQFTADMYEQVRRGWRLPAM
jgi:D-alanyl-D-alanine dipeptidase